MSSFFKKLVMVMAIVTFVLFIALVIAAWIMGMFARVSITQDVRGPYYIISQSHIGPYQGMAAKIEQVSQYLNKQQIEHSIACAIFYDDPAKVLADELKSKGGFVVSDSSVVSPPFICQKFPMHPVVVASIKANPALARFKTYPALEDWQIKYNLHSDTTHAIIELYHTDGRVEVEWPISTANNSVTGN